MGLKKTFFKGFKRNLLIGLLIGLGIVPFVTRVNNPSYRTDGTSIFKDGGLYLIKRFSFNPKVGDWVMYSIQIPPENPCKGKYVGKISRIQKDTFNIISEGYSYCDSGLQGNFKPKIHALIYPQYEIPFLSPLFRKINLLFTNKKSHKQPLKAIPDFLKNSVQFYRIQAQHFTLAGVVISDREYLVKKEILQQQGKIKMEVFLKLGAGNLWRYEFEMNRENNSDVFTIAPNKYLSGTLTYFGKEWEWSKWNYDISINSGESIKGSSFLTTKGLRTEKYVFQKGMGPNIKIVDFLESISESEYKHEFEKNISTPTKVDRGGFHFM